MSFLQFFKYESPQFKVRFELVTILTVLDDVKNSSNKPNINDMLNIKT